jgi:flavorubredoxin
VDIPKYFLMDAAKKFYANLITPLSMLVLRKFEEIKELELLEKINMIAPSHGQIWTDPMQIISAYSDWATGKCENMATIVYDTMHFSTRKMAYSLSEGLIDEDIKVNMYFLHEDERSEIVKDILESKALLVGVPTLYNEPYPSVGDFMYYLRGLNFGRTGVRRLAVTFGSKGWSGKTVDKLAESLEQCGFQVQDKYEVDYVPTEDELNKCYQIGRKLGEEIKKAW